MTQIIKAHLIKRKMAYLLSMLVVAMGLGVYLSLVGGYRAYAAISGVTLTDSDSTGYGLDGRDFTVSWTVSGSAPAGYAGTQLYVMASTSFNQLSTTTVTTTGCGGSACVSLGFATQYAQTSMTVPQSHTTDSSSTAWSTQANFYKAALLIQNTNPLLNELVTSSAAMTASFDNVSDTSAPQIEHLGVNVASVGVAAVFHAFIFDDQTTSTPFGVTTTVDAGAEYVTLYYGSDVSAGKTSLQGEVLEGDLFSFSVPTSSVPAAAGTFEYYLEAKDRAGNVKFFCNSSTANTRATCEAAPFVVTTQAIGGRSVSGLISSGGAGLGTARVFVAGYATSSVQTGTGGSVGQYTIGGLPNSNTFDFSAYKSGYCKNKRNEIIGTADLSNINMNLIQGSCGFNSHGGGGAPRVMFSGPPTGMTNVPISDRIRVGFNQPMKASTINDLDASDASSNIYLTPNDGTTKVAGQVLYCANSSAAGCSALPPQDTNVIVFNQTSSLTTGTLYTLVINEAVTSEGGQSIEGNRRGGGHQITFTTVGGSFTGAQIGGSFGQSGQYMPPFVRAVLPGAGKTAPPNIDIGLEFNEALQSATVNASNIQVVNNTTRAPVSLASVSLDSNENRFVAIDPGTLPAGEYEVLVKGTIANATGVSMRPAGTAGDNFGFRSKFTVSGSADSTAPSITPFTTDNSTGVAVNIGKFDFGFSEAMALSTLNATNVTMARGANNASVDVRYDPSSNVASVIPANVLSPNTKYTITFGTGVTDLTGIASSTAAVFTYTTGNADTAAPNVVEGRCDDYTCFVQFSEPMNRHSLVDSNFAASVLNPANITLTEGGGPDQAVSSTSYSYDARKNALNMKGLRLTAGMPFTLTVGAGVADLSGNAINTGNNANVVSATCELSSRTFGDFGGQGMFGPPLAGLLTTGAGGALGGPGGVQTIGGGEFNASKAGHFGSFSPEEFSFGRADTAFPRNNIAGQDSNIFQIKFSGQPAVQNGDQFQFTFPNGTTVTNAALASSTVSPANGDMNGLSAGTVTGTAVTVDNSLRRVTVTLGVSGTTAATDKYTIDLQRIINPPLPSVNGGYTVTIKALTSGVVNANNTTMPYFIQKGGSNTFHVRLFAGTATTSPTSGANGDVFLFGGGPSGPMGKKVTLTNGVITSVDGVTRSNVEYTNLLDGSYFVSTEPSVSLGGSDYFGKFANEPVSLNSSNSSTTLDILLTASGGTASVPVTVKIADSGSNSHVFGAVGSGVDIDLFAGGPGRFVVKTLSAVTTTNPNGYTIQIPANGSWSVGFGPAMPKGSFGSMPKVLNISPPSPIGLTVAGVGTGSPTVSPGFNTPPGTSFNDSTDTVTFTAVTADKTVNGTVTDGSTALEDVKVFMHRQGFSAPAFGTTDANGAFSLAVSDFSTYEIGTFKDGLPPVSYSIDVRPDGSDAGTDPDIFFKGKQITAANPLIITLNRASYTISGKVLDTKDNGIPAAPVFATEATNGNFVAGMTSSDGSYILFVSAGTWQVRAKLPPNETSTCGTLSKTITVAASVASQNLTPSTGTCYTLSGTVTVASTVKANVPVFIEEWDTTTDRPSGGFFKGSSTNGSGVYTANVSAGTYRVGTFDPSFGELSITQTVTNANVTSADINSGTTGNVGFTFTGGSPDMDAFIELKKSDDARTRINKKAVGLNSGTTFVVKSGTYNYFVKVFGIGEFTGTASTGATTTIDVSANSFITVSGNVKNDASSNVSGALVTLTDATNKVTQTALTDSSGNYSLQVKAGSYAVSASVSEHLPVKNSSTVTFSATTTNYDFGGASPDQIALTLASRVITGIIYESDGTTVMKDASVWAENASGLKMPGTVSPSNGTYSISVPDGAYSVYAVGPRHTKTSLGTTVTISGSDSGGGNITLKSDSTKVPKSVSGSLAANTGGSIDDSDNSGIKLSCSAGALEAGSGDVNINMEKSYKARETTNYNPLGGASFGIAATGGSNTTIKNLASTADIQIDYSGLVSSLPSGVSESSLQLAYYSEARGEYVPVEGGFTIDTTNNLITAQVDHFTDFVIVFTPSAAIPSATPTPVINPSASAGSATGPNPPAAASPGAQTFKSAPKVLAQKTYKLNEPVKVSVGASAHTVTVTAASETSATITIASTPITVTLTRGVSKDVDTNGDGISDLRVTYTGLVDGLPLLGFVNLTDAGEMTNAVTINNGAYETDSRTVTLSFKVTNVTQMAIINSADFSDTSFIPFTPTTTWTLGRGNGDKTVRVKFRSDRGGILDASDTIKLTGEGFDQTSDVAVWCPLAVGKAYRKTDTTGVYRITADCKKRPFRNQAVFFSYFTSWGEVETVSADVLDKIENDAVGFVPWGPLYQVKEGGLVKVISDPKVYLMKQLKRHWIVSETVFNSLGYVWNTIQDVAQNLLDKFAPGADIAGSKDLP